ncbi:sugar-transfer associated ATP-grasp domain-containing protein [Bacteroides heparinolyticus]|uniref:sugar-transfer associated ATP-grasp domain-containing protein n=1 Tax=Prevotella heparinolytica TaxID=28113 RepID=UPI0035A00C35
MNQVMVECNNKNYIHLLKEKNKFNEFFGQFVHRDWIFCGDANEAEFRTFLLKHEEVIVKPSDTYEGKGIHKVSTKSMMQDISKYFKEYKAGNFMMEEVSQNHPEISFGGMALNTIRVYSFLDAQGKPHILKAVLRCGTGTNIVDNFHSGGVGYEIDLNTGIVISVGRSWDREDIVVHPGTNLSVIGMHIPEWECVKSQCLAAAKLIPQCRYVAWDIAITEHGVEFIEGNHDGDFDLLEFMGTTGYWKIIKEYI